MYIFGIDEVERLKAAKARGVELQADWRSANMSRSRSSRDGAAPRRRGMRVREAASRFLIGAGERVAPAEIEPCR